MNLPKPLLSRGPRPFGFPQSAPQRVNPVDLDATLPLAPEHPQEVRQVLEMKCLGCQAPVERRTTEVHLHRNGYALAWKNLPAWVCSRCKQPYFEPAEVEMVRQALGAISRLQSRA